MPHNQKKPSSRAILAIVAAVLFLAIAAVASVHYAVRNSSDGPEAAVARLSEAVKAKDVDAAMAMIDFDAVFDGLWRVNAARVLGVSPDDPKVAASMASPTIVQARDSLRKSLLRSLAHPSAQPGDTGTFYAALASLDQGKVERVADDKAYVYLQDEWKLYLANVPSKGWTVVGYGGYEDDFESYKARSVKLMQDRGLAPPTKGEGPAPAENGEQTAP